MESSQLYNLGLFVKLSVNLHSCLFIFIFMHSLMTLFYFKTVYEECSVHTSVILIYFLHFSYFTFSFSFEKMPTLTFFFSSFSFFTFTYIRV